MTAWSWGANSHGQLSQSHYGDQLLPKAVEFDEGSKIKFITGGGGHTLAITASGKLYTCGANDKGQLGLNTTDDVSLLTLIEAFHKQNVIATAGGWDFTLALTDSSELYCWGSNAFGQLGDATLPKKCMEPTKVGKEYKFVGIAAGLRHSIGLTDTGDVYCWGHAKKGQCGVVLNEKPPVKVTSPTKVLLPDGVGKVTLIVAGSYHTVALTDRGCLFVWGCNKYAQCTVDPEVTSQLNNPHMISKGMFGNQKVKVVKSGWTHLIAQTESGDMFSWGRRDYGQLGRPMPPGLTCSHIPGKLDLNMQISSFCCGSEHTLFLSADKELYAVGWNEHGLCATGDENNVEKVSKIEAFSHQSVILIGCGGGHCFAVTHQKSDYG